MNLFLGVQLTNELQAELNPSLLALFRGYLSEVSYKDVSFIGKQTEQMPTIDELDNLESHIQSLLKRLAPKYKLQPCQLIISLP